MQSSFSLGLQPVRDLGRVRGDTLWRCRWFRPIARRTLPLNRSYGDPMPCSTGTDNPVAFIDASCRLYGRSLTGILHPSMVPLEGARSRPRNNTLISCNTNGFIGMIHGSCEVTNPGNSRVESRVNSATASGCPRTPYLSAIRSRD